MDWLATQAPTMEEKQWKQRSALLERKEGVCRLQGSFSACHTASARLPCHHQQLQPQEL